MTDGLAAVKKLISDCEQKYGREPGSVKLLIASKGRSIEQIKKLYAAGQVIFGENYLQEAEKKITALAATNIEWHFIGPIQSNKAKKIAEHFAFVHSVASMKTAKRLNDHRPAHLPPLNICIEVNISNEASKSGIHPNELLALAAYCKNMPRLKLRGLMALPHLYEDLEAQRREFKKLTTLAKMLRENDIELDTLSAGTSADFEAAIAEGATMVRIGELVFGN